MIKDLETEIGYDIMKMIADLRFLISPFCRMP